MVRQRVSTIYSLITVWTIILTLVTKSCSEHSNTKSLWWEVCQQGPEELHKYEPRLFMTLHLKNSPKLLLCCSFCWRPREDREATAILAASKSTHWWVPDSPTENLTLNYKMAVQMRLQSKAGLRSDTRARGHTVIWLKKHLSERDIADNLAISKKSGNSENWSPSRFWSKEVADLFKHIHLLAYPYTPSI